MALRGEPRAQRRSAFEHFDESRWLTGVRERLRTALWEHAEPLDTVAPPAPPEHDDVPEDPHAKAHMQRASDAMQELLALGGIVDEEHNRPVRVDGFAERVWRVDQPPEESTPSSLFSAFDRGTGVDIDALLQFRMQAAEREEARADAPKPKKPKPMIEEIGSDTRDSAQETEESSESEESESESEESEESEGSEESEESEEGRESEESEGDESEERDASDAYDEEDELVDDHGRGASQIQPVADETHVLSAAHDSPSRHAEGPYDDDQDGEEYGSEEEGYDDQDEGEYSEEADEDDLAPTSSHYDADEPLHDSESMYDSASYPSVPSTDRFMMRPSALLSKQTHARPSYASHRGQEDSPIVVLSESEDEERIDEAAPDDERAEWSGATQRSEEEFTGDSHAEEDDEADEMDEEDEEDEMDEEDEEDGAHAPMPEHSDEVEAASEDEMDDPDGPRPAGDAAMETGETDDAMREDNDETVVAQAPGPSAMQETGTAAEGTTGDAGAAEGVLSPVHPHDTLDKDERAAEDVQDSTEAHPPTDDGADLDAREGTAPATDPDKEGAEAVSDARTAAPHEDHTESHPSSPIRFSKEAHDEAQQAGHSADTFARELASEMGLEMPLSMPEGSGAIAEDAWPSFAHTLHTGAPLSAPLLLDDEGHPRFDMSALLHDEYTDAHGHDGSHRVPLRYGALPMDDREAGEAAVEDQATEAHPDEAPTELASHTASRASTPADAEEDGAAAPEDAEAAEEDDAGVPEGVDAANDAADAADVVPATNDDISAKHDAETASIDGAVAAEPGTAQKEEAAQSDAQAAERRTDVEVQDEEGRARPTSPPAVHAESDETSPSLRGNHGPDVAEPSTESEIPQGGDLSADQVEAALPKRGAVTSSQAHAAHTSRHVSDGPITRSHCTLQRVTLLREAGAPTFLVPSCALDTETLDEEGAEKQDLFTDQLEMMPLDPGALPEPVYHALCRIVSPSLLDDVYVTPSSLGAQWMAQDDSDTASDSASLDDDQDVPPAHAVRQTYSRRHRRPRKSDPSSDVANYVPPETAPHRPSSPADVSIEELEALAEPSPKRARMSASPPPRMQLRTARERRRTRRFSPS